MRMRRLRAMSTTGYHPELYAQSASCRTWEDSNKAQNTYSTSPRQVYVCVLEQGGGLAATGERTA